MKRNPPPAILQSYLAFCTIRRRYNRSGRLELDTDFVFPTTLLPLAVLVAHCKKPVQATNRAVQGYVDWIIRADDPLVGNTYVPVVRLPKDPGAYQDVLQHLEDLTKTSQLFSGNKDAYHYLLSELVDNIYEHAKANRAYVMAQLYPKKGLIEASFMDDGMTIPRSLERGTGTKYPPEMAHRAILDALGGKSAKGGGQRGYGLRTSVNIVNELGGLVLIVSGRGAIAIERRNHPVAYLLPLDCTLDGTLVSLRLPNSGKRINLYDLVDS